MGKSIFKIESNYKMTPAEFIRKTFVDHSLENISKTYNRLLATEESTLKNKRKILMMEEGVKEIYGDDGMKKLINLSTMDALINAFLIW